MSPARVLLFGLLLWALPAAASAATLSIDPTTLTMAKGDTVIISLNINAEKSINTVGTAVFIPKGLRWMGSEKGTILTQWIEDPSFDDTDSSVSFSGVITGGWKGSGTLIKLQFVAQAAGTYTFAYDPARTELYQNDGKGTKEQVIFGTIAASPLPLFLWGILAALILLGWYLKRMVRFRFV